MRRGYLLITFQLHLHFLLFLELFLQGLDHVLFLLHLVLDMVEFHEIRHFLAFLLLALSQGAERNITAEVTFFGARDNCPPGGDIAHPIIHKVAGGTGTYADPITFAGASASIPVGTRIYLPRLKKYFIFEDDCEECISDWSKNKKYHVDCWMGPDTLSDSSIVACENQLTMDSDHVVVDATDGFQVDLRALYANGQCIEHADPCTDVGTECGNSCEIPKSDTCDALAKEFGLTLARFKALNPHLNCDKTVSEGTSVCQGGTCGD